MTPRVLGKRKSATEAPARGDQKEADPEVQQEVETWILDYVLFQATTALLNQHNAERDGESLPEAGKPDLPLAMADAFLGQFKAKHPPQAISSDLKFRLRLLQFVSLFTRRLRPTTCSPTDESLQRLRNMHQTRATMRRTYIPPDFDESPRIWNVFPLSEINLTINRELALKSLKVKQAANNATYGFQSSVAMLDLLPLFMSLSAHLYQETGGEVKGRWLELAAEFMLQAALEQYLIQGTCGTEILHECFSFGWRPKDIANRKAKHRRNSHHLADHEYQEMDKEEEIINDMFYDEDNHTEIEGWKEIRERIIGFFKPEKDIGIVRQLELTASQYPVFDFEGKVMSFLGALLKSRDLPILVQLEEGKLEGMSAKETAELKAKVGLQL
ncbi:hypothetical protein EV356DRAFT_141639 [Viridothelium virens]|uniref:Uncharacterized protein n=1 Tax=Viridothelium virens TaxID=1048519 RepID=A0A6A6HA24_VIRVR|nr:hypothetical protein EV356DRAFT_141639 [Viridothelium virens]